MTKLDEHILETEKTGDKITMDDLLLKVGLSPRMKETVPKLTSIQDDANNRPFDGSFKNRRTTELKIMESGVIPYLMSPSNKVDLENRNRNDSIIRNPDMHMNDEQNLALVKKLKEDKEIRLKRENDRRMEMLAKYT